MLHLVINIESLTGVGGGGDIQDWRSLTMTSHKKIHLDLNPLETM